MLQKKDRLFELIVNDDQHPRLDQFLSKQKIDISRSQIQKLIKDNKIKVNQKLVKAGYRLKKDDRIEVTIPAPEKIDLSAQNIPISIIYNDQDLAVINKPAGLVVHPAPGNLSNTLVNALLYHLNDLSGIGGKLRPGIVHRLDKETSGIMLIAKNDKAHQGLSEQLKQRKINKTYLALVHGKIKQKQGRMETFFGRHPKNRKKMSVLKSAKKSRLAITEYNVLKEYGDYSLVELKLITGRTHQIRVHMNYIKHPVLGDKLYGLKKEKINAARQMLHAHSIMFLHPTTNEKIILTAELPDDFKKIMNKLG